MTQAMELARHHQSLDPHDDMSSESETEVRASGSARTLRPQARLRHHLKILLSSTDVTALRNAMSLLEQILVRAPTKNIDREIVTEFLESCDYVIPSANADAPATADVALVAVGSLPCAGGHRKSVHKNAVASFLYHLPAIRLSGAFA